MIVHPVAIYSAVLFSLLSPLRASKCRFSINDVALRGHVFEAIQADNFHVCNEECKKRISCRSTNYYRDSKLCEFNNRTIAAKPHQKVAHDGAAYFDRLNPVSIGSHEEIPAESCMEIKNISGSSASGVFWVKNAIEEKVQNITCNGGIPDYCSSNACANGGTCVSGAHNFTCACPASFQGKTCTAPKGSSWQEYTAYWCTSTYRHTRVERLTKEQCKAKCTGDCKGMEWWGTGTTPCFFCTDPSKRQPYTNTKDGAYPPHVLVRS